jgi:hypothetical protein
LTRTRIPAKREFMGKGRALLLLLGVGGLLLATPGLMRQGLPRNQAHRAVGELDLPTIAGGGDVPFKSVKRTGGSPGDLPSRIIAALETTDDTEHRIALEALLPDLIKRDPAAAAELALGLAEWERREQALRKVADTWAASDPHAAVAWAAGLENEFERIMCVGSACTKISRAEPALAVSLAWSVYGLRESPHICFLAGYWLASDRPAAEAWIMNISDPHLRDRMWSEAALNLGSVSPEQAAILAAEKISPGPLQEEAVISALHQWVLTDRQAAAAWVELFPEGPLRERAEGELFGAD